MVNQIRDMAHRFIRLILSSLDGRNRFVSVTGLLIAIWMGVAPWISRVPVPEVAITLELKKESDWRNLYFAAKQSNWSDVPKWFTGSWIYPDVAYYRPVTSILFLAEQRLWDRDFSNYNRVSLGFHAVNCALTFMLTLALFRNHPRGKVILGLIAVAACMTPYSSVSFGIDRGVSWWPAQNDIVSLTFALGFLWAFERHIYAGQARWLATSMVLLLLAICSKEMAYIAPLMAFGLALPELRSPEFYRRAMIALGTVTIVTSAMWVLRRITVPNAWGPVWARTHLINKALLNWFGPVYFQVTSNDWWAIVGAVIVIAFGISVWRRGIPVQLALIGSSLGLLACAQWLPGGSTWALLFADWGIGKVGECLALFTFVLLVFWGRNKERSVLIYAWYLLVYVPILQYGGQHYFYWPAPFLGLTVALFTALIVGFIRENILPRLPELETLIRDQAVIPEKEVSCEMV